MSEKNNFIEFPSDFFWGTSTAAAQIETASAHNWRGVKSKDGYIFDRTTDHEKRRDEDLEYIRRFGSVYRCGVDWARLQTEPMASFEPLVVSEYLFFFEKLKARGVKIMFVIHHFTHPLWFEALGAFTKAENLSIFHDFAEKCILYFGDFVNYWNTFNEPNVYALNAYLLGNFPPKQKNKYQTANRVLKNMGLAHDILYEQLKGRFPDVPVGISFNTALFEGKNILGKAPARFMDWWFIEKAAEPFEQCDFWGLSYYAYVLFDPLPITEIDRPGDLEKMGIPHDDMWGYKPEGLGTILRRFYKKYQKPIIITENGICSVDPKRRIQCLKDYLSVCHQCIAEGILLQGYIHWSTFDNFEWNLGPTYRFGLVSVDLETKDRNFTEAAVFYERLTQENGLEI